MQSTTQAELPSLHAAARANDVALVDALLMNEAVEIDAPDARGYSALMLATYSGSMEAFELLLARGANPSGADKAGNTILMAAAFKGSVQMVSRLLELGAAPHARNTAGMSARDFAEQFGRYEVAALLPREVRAAAS